MYLSRLILDPRNREAQRDLGDCHVLHRRVMSGFPAVNPDDGPAREALAVLFRVDPLPKERLAILLVQSRVEPDWADLPQGYLADRPRNSAVKSIAPIIERVHSGARCRFRLRANPTRRIHTRNSEQSADALGKRVDVRGDVELTKWLERKAETGGFRVVEVARFAGVPDAAIVGRSRVQGAPVHGTGRGKRMTFSSITFEGRLEVTNSDVFRMTLEKGVGSGKAFGFGLLSIAPG